MPKKILDLKPREARSHFLKGSSYFNNDLPLYLSFEPLLKNVDAILTGRPFTEMCHQDKSKWPKNISNVNYQFMTNKDGKLAWRPLEIMHPVIYISLVNYMTMSKNWKLIGQRFQEFSKGYVHCCSALTISDDTNSDRATQINHWWIDFEQRSLKASLQFSHLVQTDVSDCYGSIYTHSIAWALHGKDLAKQKQGPQQLLGNNIDWGCPR